LGVNLGAGIALTAAAGNLSMAVLHAAIARAPGWRAARLFASLALTATFYNIFSAVLYSGAFPAAIYVEAGRLAYLVGTLHGVLWLVYAYSDGSGTFDALPAWVRRLAISIVLAAMFFAVTGWLLRPEISVIDIGWLGIRYHYPAMTRVGAVYGLMLIGVGCAPLLRIGGRFLAGERALGLQLCCYGVFLVCAIDEVLVVNRFVQFPSVLDVGFLIVVMSLSWQTVGRIIGDARRLHDVSGRLESRRWWTPSSR
jgi:hypothetical protein